MYHSNRAVEQDPRVLLELRDLTYRYGQKVAVDALNLSVPRGSFFGLLGPNGAGKSTTIQCIAGLLADWTGGMTFAQQPFVPATNIDDRQRIGFVPQELAIYGELTARENLKFFGRLAGLRKLRLGARVEHAIGLSGLEGRADDRVAEFSGGMKRRLNLAIGQLHQPDLLLLDEPTAGVDPQSRAHLFEALKTLNQDGTTILYTTHYMEEVEKLCDQIAIMNSGKVIASGTAEELAQSIGNPQANLESVFLELTGRKLRD